MARKNIKFSSGVFFVVLLIAANVLLLLPQEHTKKLNYFFVRITSPLLNIIPGFQPSKNDTVAKSKYGELLESYENLQARLDHAMKNYEKLSGIRVSLPLPGPAIVLAQVSRISIDGQRSEIVINKGSANGLKKKQYVLSTGSGNVIGTIRELSKTMARVQLVTDSNHYITVDIWRDGKEQGIRGQMNGNNEMQGKIPLIVAESDIRVDDSVFATLNPGLLETPLIIGKISEVVHDQWNPQLWDITVTPIVDIRSVTDVAVVVFDADTSAGGEEN